MRYSLFITLLLMIHTSICGEVTRNRIKMLTIFLYKKSTFNSTNTYTYVVAKMQEIFKVLATKTEIVIKTKRTKLKEAQLIHIHKFIFSCRIRCLGSVLGTTQQAIKCMLRERQKKTNADVEHTQVELCVCIWTYTCKYVCRWLVQRVKRGQYESKISKPLRCKRILIRRRQFNFTAVPKKSRAFLEFQICCMEYIL